MLMTTNVIGHRRFYNFYFKLFLALLFCFIMTFFIAMLRDQSNSIVGFYLLMSFILIFTVYTILKFIKSAPYIVVNDQYIKRNFQIYLWADLEEVQFSGKHRYFFAADNKEGMLLKFNGKNAFTIFDDLYSNIDEIKQFVKYSVIEKTANPFSRSVEQQSIETNDEKFIFYKNFQLLNFRSFILWSCVVLISLCSIINATLTGILILFIFDSLFIWWLSIYQNYFGVSSHFFVVKNQTLPWMKKVFMLDDINEIVFEQEHHKLPNSLRVITNDFKSESFMASSLWTKNWFQLKDELEKKNITVRNESIIDL
jgi:hypothetical protein